MSASSLALLFGLCWGCACLIFFCYHCCLASVVAVPTVFIFSFSCSNNKCFHVTGWCRRATTRRLSARISVPPTEATVLYPLGHLLTGQIISQGLCTTSWRKCTHCTTCQLVRLSARVFIPPTEATVPIAPPANRADYQPGSLYHQLKQLYPYIQMQIFKNPCKFAWHWKILKNC